MPASVRLLDSHTVNQIAAGEVVERPASVLKELVENALDAGARKIQIELRDSGKTLIRVSDDGAGMSAEDAFSCLQRHATSKITSVEDLLAVRTLGFRGEALPSIASVSRMQVSSATEDGLRTVIQIEGGEVRPVAGSAGPRGTEVTVEDLFYNTPARLKFLKSDTTELGQSIEVVSRYAIAYPHVCFVFTHNGQEAIHTSGNGEMLDAVGDVWGREAARALAEVRTELGGLRVQGFVSPPHFTKPTRAYQYVFVNGRPVRTRTLTAALDQAYRDLTPERRYPLLALIIDIDPALVDVNVSPTKSEVKFQREGQAFEALRMAIKSALMEHGMMPSVLSSGVAAANVALSEVGSGRSEAGLGFDFAMRAQAPLTDYRLGSNFERDDPQPTTYDPQPIAHNPLPTAQPPASRYPFGDLMEGLRVIGQAMDTFIIAETARGIVIIDQHVAHERILYEYLCGLKGSTAIEKQALLVPQTLHLDKRAAVLLRDRIAEVEAVGFDLEPFGGESYVVRAVPAAIRQRDPLKVLQNLIDELVESSVTRRLVPTREQIWITSACKMAVKAGDPLSIAEMEKLIVDLAETENPYMCPHGRPITLTLTADDLLRKFKRT